MRGTRNVENELKVGDLFRTEVAAGEGRNVKTRVANTFSFVTCRVLEVVGDGFDAVVRFEVVEGDGERVKDGDRHSMKMYKKARYDRRTRDTRPEQFHYHKV